MMLVFLKNNPEWIKYLRQGELMWAENKVFLEFLEI